jgi:hypothetical protein
MRRYFPTFMAGIFAGIFSIVFVLVLYIEAFFRQIKPGDGLEWLLGSALIAVGYMCVCHFFLVWGRVVWVWGIAFLFVICLCAALPIIEYRPIKILYFLALLAPLIGLLVLNSDRHREMRKILFLTRYKRNRFLGIRNARLSRLKAGRCK